MATSCDIPSTPQAKEKIQCPVPYEELNREVISALKPHCFEGMRVDFTKGLNQKFTLSHSLSMGPTEIATKSPETIKTPTSEYEFGANYFDPKLMLIGRVTTDGQLMANMKYDLSENLSIKANALLSDKPNMSKAVANFDYKGTDYRAQVQLRNGGLVAANYIQSVTPKLSMGGEVFWYDEHQKSGLGYAARYATDKMVATGQVTSTGVASLGYVHKVSDKLSLASDLIYDHSSRDVTASVGYDCKFNHQSRLRGKIDSNGRISGFLEEKLNIGLKLCLSAEVDHRKKDYKFGIGLVLGE